MKLPRLIGLYSPAPGCGKSTVADLLTEHRTVSFAAPIKRVVEILLDRLGSDAEWGRACIHPDFWVMIARAKVQRIMNDDGFVVLDDVRFPNEAAMIFELGGELWRIDRPGITYDGDHSSEGGLEDITPNRVIVNDGTIAQLLEKIYG